MKSFSIILTLILGIFGVLEIAGSCSVRAADSGRPMGKLRTSGSSSRYASSAATQGRLMQQRGERVGRYRNEVAQKPGTTSRYQTSAGEVSATRGRLSGNEVRTMDRGDRNDGSRYSGGYGNSSRDGYRSNNHRYGRTYTGGRAPVYRYQEPNPRYPSGLMRSQPWSNRYSNAYYSRGQYQRGGKRYGSISGRVYHGGSRYGKSHYGGSYRGGHYGRSGSGITIRSSGFRFR